MGNVDWNFWGLIRNLKWQNLMGAFFTNLIEAGMEMGMGIGNGIAMNKLSRFYL